MLRAFLLGAVCSFFSFASAGIPFARAQELQTQPTPFTALLDLSVLQHPAAKALPSQGLPIWLEAVQIIHSDPGETPAHTTFRIRLRPMAGLNDSLLLRLFFEDRPETHPVVTAWTETGDRQFSSGPLGAGLDLPASEALAISTKKVNYLEIDVPGDGSSVHQALLATLKTSEVGAAFDFAPPPALADPFNAAAPASVPGSPPATVNDGDTFLFGRVRATLEPGPLKLTPPGPNKKEEDSNTVSFGFNLETEPLLALVTFDILDADPAAPLMAWANGEPVGAVAFQLPDLADPGYTGTARPLEKMRFHYAGWVRCQKIIPGRVLRAGENTFTLQLPADAGPVAIRAVELQLKNRWKKLDYNLSPF